MLKLEMTKTKMTLGKEWLEFSFDVSTSTVNGIKLHIELIIANEAYAF